MVSGIEIVLSMRLQKNVYASRRKFEPVFLFLYSVGFELSYRDSPSSSLVTVSERCTKGHGCHSCRGIKFH